MIEITIYDNVWMGDYVIASIVHPPGQGWSLVWDSDALPTITNASTRDDVVGFMLAELWD